MVLAVFEIAVSRGTADSEGFQPCVTSRLCRLIREYFRNSQLGGAAQYSSS
jgi:hypothetical protein